MPQEKINTQRWKYISLRRDLNLDIFCLHRKPSLRRRGGNIQPAATVQKGHTLPTRSWCGHEVTHGPSLTPHSSFNSYPRSERSPVLLTVGNNLLVYGYRKSLARNIWFLKDLQCVRPPTFPHSSLSFPA